jgi:hypothetical protein
MLGVASKLSVRSARISSTTAIPRRIQRFIVLSQDELLSRGIGEYAATLLNSSGTVGVKNSNVLTNTISQIMKMAK